MFFVQSQLNARQEDGQTHDIYMQELENAGALAVKLAGGKGPKGTEGLTEADWAASRRMTATDSPWSTIDKNDNYEQITAERVRLEGLLKQVHGSATIEARQLGLPAGIALGTPEGEQWLNTFKTGAKGDPTKQGFLNRYAQQRQAVNVQNTLYKKIQDNIDAVVAPAAQAAVSAIPGVVINGRTISATDVFSAINGKPTNGITIVEQPNADADGVVRSYTPQIYVDGQFHRDARILFNTIQKKSTEVRNTKNQMAAEENVVQREVYDLPTLNDKDGSFKQRIAQGLGISEKYRDKIQIGATNARGGLMVTLYPPGKNEPDYPYEDALKRLKNYGGEDNQVTPGKENEVILRNIPELNVIRDSDVTKLLPTLMRNVEKVATRNGTDSTPALTSLSGTEYIITVTRGVEGSHNYFLIDKAFPQDPIAIYQTQSKVIQDLQTLLKK